MSGEPIRLLDDSSIRDEIRQRLSLEATVKPQYDFERGLARLRATIANGPSDPGSGPSSEPPSSRLSITNYAVKGSVWKLAGVVGLAATAAFVGLHAWGPATHVGRIEATAFAPSFASQAQGGTEADNLVQIKAALPVDPHRALSLVEDGNTRFVSGALREEREASAIAALSVLGRAGEAQVRARRFLEDYPKSLLAERVRQSARL